MAEAVDAHQDQGGPERVRERFDAVAQGGGELALVEQRRFEAMKGKFRHSWTSLHNDDNWKMVASRVGVGSVA